MCIFSTHQHLCLYPAGPDCGWRHLGCVTIEDQRRHLTGETEVVSSACFLRRKKGSSVPDRNCELTRPGRTVQVHYIRDERLCARCAERCRLPMEF